MAVIVATRIGDTIAGTAGDDSITGSTGADSIDSGPGGDTINGGGGIGGDAPRFVDTLHGGDGDDRIVGTLSGILFGDAGADTLIGTPDFSRYTLDGGGGDDRLEASPDDNGAFASYALATSGVQVSLAIAAPQAVGGGQGVDTLVGIRGLIGSDFADTLTAPATGGTLVGGAGDDRLVGGDGLGNQFDTGTGTDTVLGGAGRDSVSFGTPAGGLTVDLADHLGPGGGRRRGRQDAVQRGKRARRRLRRHSDRIRRCQRAERRGGSRQPFRPRRQ